MITYLTEEALQKYSTPTLGAEKKANLK